MHLVVQGLANCAGHDTQRVSLLKPNQRVAKRNVRLVGQLSRQDISVGDAGKIVPSADLHLVGIFQNKLVQVACVKPNFFFNAASRVQNNRVAVGCQARGRCVSGGRSGCASRVGVQQTAGQRHAVVVKELCASACK